MTITLQKTAYGGWDNTYTLANGRIELGITADVGPRLIRLGYVNEHNLFFENPHDMGKISGDDWRIYGGHRLWHAPEVKPRTYYPDNHAVDVRRVADHVEVIQPIESTTGIQKTLLIHMREDSDAIQVVHQLTNHGMWSIECGLWALSVMAAETRGIIPLPPRASHTDHLLPTNTLTMWAYTHLNDPRFTLGKHYILLQQDSSATTPQKIGADVRDNWVASVNHGTLFVKTFQRQEGYTYPDLGCTVEVFTNEVMLEVETLSPMRVIEPGETVSHVENWFLFKEVSTPQDDADVERDILPHVMQAKDAWMDYSE